MIIKGLTDEDFVNYKVPSMVIITSFCSFKCDKESGIECCQNSSLAKQKSRDISDEIIIERYIRNPITKAIVMAGLEPFDQFGEVCEFIETFRSKCDDDIVIYTGYNKDEIQSYVSELSKFSNIIIKYGRFIPDQPRHYDEVLGVYLASPNQYAERLTS